MAHFALCSRPDIAPAAPSTVNTAMRSPQTESFKPDGSLKEEFGTSDVSESDPSARLLEFTSGFTPFPCTAAYPQLDSHVSFDHLYLYPVIPTLPPKAHTDVGQRPRRQKHSRKARKFVPLDLETIESKPQVSAADSTSIAHQPPNPNRNARSKARGEAVVIVPAQHSRPTVPARSTPIRSVHDSTTKKPRRGRKLNDMVTPPPSAYIPPHVRKRAAAPAQIKTDVKLGDSIDIKSPPTSVKSRGEDPLPSQVHLYVYPASVAAQCIDHFDTFLQHPFLHWAGQNPSLRRRLRSHPQQQSKNRQRLGGNTAAGMSLDKNRQLRHRSRILTHVGQERRSRRRRGMSG